VKCGVDGMGLSELIFKDYDATRRIEGGTAVDQFTSPRGDPQLIAGIAPVSALGALGCEKFGLVEASQEPWGSSQDLGGATHAVCGVVLVVELIVRVTVGRFVVRVYHNTFRGALRLPLLGIRAPATRDFAHGKGRRPGALNRTRGRRP
jgi:hypothetical protein